MKKRPFILVAWALSFALIALSFPLQIGLTYGHSFKELSLIFSKITLLNWLVISALLVNIPLLLRASLWVSVSLPLTIGLVAWNNYVVAIVGHDFSESQTALATAGFILLNGLIFHPQVMLSLRQPRKRWWLQCPRKKIRVPIQVTSIRGPAIHLNTFDLSATGAFIPFGESFSPQTKYAPGKKISLKLSLDLLNEVRCSAEIIRSCPSQGHYPGGLGLRFLDLSRQDRKSLDSYLNRFPQNNLSPELR